MELIDKHILKRTSRAIKCLALNSNFYKDVESNGLTAKNVFEMRARYSNKSLHWFKDSECIESAFRWLITIGVLRREVDGQGLTSKVRLTPLGRQFLQMNPDLPNQQANLYERFRNWLFRKLILQ
ncbi:MULTISPECIES: Npun_F0494 family protein [Prochlorococcus]|uniref:Npun_F0494 family protein n=1 Tax=Prochlorococcus TaxID=1218 RepID=UPI00053378F7|nr:MULTISPECIES: Npun_F0494 family protein [Prochlorococcus]KGG12113.1 hypothetical protein EV05_1316 [Prochlorococcus sp. MIT 0601]